MLVTFGYLSLLLVLRISNNGFQFNLVPRTIFKKIVFSSSSLSSSSYSEKMRWGRGWFLIAFQNKVFKLSAFLASFVRILSLSASVNYSGEFVLSEKKAWTVLQDCFPQYLSRLKLVLTYLCREILLNVGYKFLKKFPHHDICNKLIKRGNKTSHTLW